MANTYTQLYIQFIFAVEGRLCLIHPSWEEELYKYLAGIIKNQKHKPIAVSGAHDHVHILVGLNPVQSISSLMQIVKGESSGWINDKGFLNGRFEWQEGYGAFSYSRSHLDLVYHYVMNQKHHHKTKTFREEYLEMLRKFEIPYDERYIFNFID